jgi:hypothetical protein
MKTDKFFSNAFFTIVLIFITSFSAFSQKNSLPSGLTEKSSVDEILQWIDTAIFPQARIGLESNASGTQQGEIPTANTAYYEWAFFSKGFKLSNVDGCKITLKNDDFKLLLFETKYPDPSKGSLSEFRKAADNKPTSTAEFSMSLQNIKANKSPYRYTKKLETENLLGTWRTEFKLKFGFTFIPSKIPTKEKIKEVIANRLALEVIGAGENGRNDSMNGDELTFTFDDKQMSEDFYNALSRAITLCKDK